MTPAPIPLAPIPLVPSPPVIPVEVVPSEAGGDTPTGVATVVIGSIIRVTLNYA